MVLLLTDLFHPVDDLTAELFLERRYASSIPLLVKNFKKDALGQPF
ncbi:MAG TPA: hypothetical protein VE860_08840 [Chthoniobacterales bacterium]|jgi:hypothetical protein|nr:hypothetical protein [Chthoniobacterales bacterium]